MESFSNLQEDRQVIIQKFKVNFKKSPKERLTIPYLETKIEILDKHWASFETTHSQIISQIDRKVLQGSDYYKKGIYDSVEDLYVELKSDMKGMLYKLKAAEESIPSSSVPVVETIKHRVKLPEIKIPIFSGHYSEWQTFRDLFLGLVHENKSLDEAQKFYYLRGHLSGEAEQLLRNFQVTSHSYKAAWTKLDQVYNNKRFLANGILRKLLNQRALMSESAVGIKQLISTTSDCLEPIKNMGVDVSTWDILVIHIISEKLDKETRKAWELKMSSDSTDKLPTFVQFSDFLVGRYRGLEYLDTKDKTNNTDKRVTKSFHITKEKNIVSCQFCSADHKIIACKKFSTQSNDMRRNFAYDKKLCFLCLNSNHSAKHCRSVGRCQVCKRRHHSLLHPSGVSGFSGDDGNKIHRDVSSTSFSSTKGNVEVDSHTNTAQAEVSKAPVVSCLSTGNSSNTVLLTTAVVQAESKDGTPRLVRALLDQGSQGSFITESMVNYLGLKKTTTRTTITGVGSNKGVTSRATVTFKIRSRFSPSSQFQVSAFVLKSVTTLLSVAKATRIEWADLASKDLADPDYHRPNKIDVLLGAEIFSRIIREGIKRNHNGSLLAQNTVFGWIFSGVSDVDKTSNMQSHITVMHSCFEGEEMLKRFWELEDEPHRTNKILTNEEMKCEELFTATTRDEKGRYKLRLPFRDEDPDCRYGDSKKIAEKRLKGLELKFQRNLKLKEDYKNVMNEYIELKHMVKIPEHQTRDNLAVYLPHHAVIRDDKDTTKVRIVFDASCKGSNGKSLNDSLMVGPPFQAELRHTIMRWRFHKICLAADIIKMYRQVFVNRQDTVFQRILWRDEPDQEIESYELVTVTFGTASAPYLAVRSLQQVAKDECQNNPELAKIIQNDFYMDDLMTGAETVKECYNIYIQISDILGKGGFKLQKWVSNSEELLDKIKEEGQGESYELRIKTDATTKILGLTWNPRGDLLQYSVGLLPLTEPITKRKIISDISRLYDPLGWLAPCIISAKVLIQRLWLAGIGWDQEVPENLQQEWVTYRNNLSFLTDVKISRWLNTYSGSVKTELYGFSDASKLAYAAVVYIRVQDDKGNVHVSLVASKTKVAPIKQISVPRLELCGAVLMAKLLVEVAEVMNIPIANLYAFTDSEVVLAWINDHPSRWKTFVANRVTEILTTLDSHHWSHVSSKQNPADCASRGVSPKELSTLSLWFDGPAFLRQNTINFKKPKHVATDLEQVRVHTIILNDFWQKFSSLTTLLRVVAYCRRFLNLRKSVQIKNTTKNLLNNEIEDARKICIKKCQEQGFSEELQELVTKGSLSGTRKLLQSLNVYLDGAGIIRVGGRLEMSQLSYNEKHPILIPKDSFLTGLLISDAHKRTMHGGPQIMVAYLRTKYWIIGVKVLARNYYRSCVTCVRYSAKTRTQLMGQLPTSRVTPNKPFLISGVDYAGPINIRISKGRGNKSYKGYIALFICMSTRAVHLEAVSELSTQGFLAAFRRFVSRRGRCAELHSDNGTNFVGAARELQCLFNDERTSYKPELADYFANNGTEWRFIPPRAPNFGGLWEAGIKSTKFHLRRIVGNSTLTFEELTTVLSQIEACLNSRPLSYVPNQQELVVLTPGHFLVGEPLVVVPDSNYSLSNVHNLRRWQLHQRMLQDFWRRWSHDYLNQFLQRHKWEHQNPEPSLGDVVLIKEDDIPPGKWLLGKIESKHPGPDGITRVVTVRSKGGLIKRPTSKLCLLPVTE